jgi:hypothetical protein
MRGWPARRGGLRHLDRFEWAFAGFVLDAQEPIAMHFLGVEPAFQSLAVWGLPFHEHLAVLEIHERAAEREGRRMAEAVHEVRSALAREAGESVEREVAWHETSWDAKDERTNVAQGD